jgi:hypothetical protein
MAQGLRPSQYITTFGPGALVETPAGPHILMGTAEVLQRIHSAPIDMELLAIRDIRLQRGLLDGDRIFKVPDSQSWERFTYPTRKFPHWNLCVQHQEFNVIHRASDGCPECRNETNRRESQKNKYAIRFLIACSNGHLDDVNWNYLIHNRRGEQQAGRCAGTHFHWLGSGSSLSAIRIRCAICSAEKPLGEIYSSRLPCRGNRPEIRNAPFEPCDAEAIVVQRGSFQLRLPEVITSLTIPPLVSAIHRILQRDDIQVLVSHLKALDQFNETPFRRLIRVNVEQRKLTSQIEAELNQTEWEDISSALIAIERASVKKSRAEYLRQEHESLIDVVETGFPPYPHDSERRQGEPISFQVEATQIRKNVRGPNGHLVFRVMPIERLRVVIVQIGHRRVEYTGPESYLSRSRGAHPSNPDEFWVPGVEQFGEGIYIDLNPQIPGQSNWYPQGPEAQKWDQTIPSATGPNELVTWNALSVWWHSVSHRLINAMSLHSGYSSTAIRERIYLTTTETGELRGGVLLYTTQPGGDGTMGAGAGLKLDQNRRAAGPMVQWC